MLHWWIVVICCVASVAKNCDARMCTDLGAYTVAVTLTRQVDRIFTYRNWLNRYRTKWGTTTEQYTVREHRTRINYRCCAGYSEHNGTCEPVCHGGCTNAECTAPQQCTCWNDHRKINQTSCAPLCENCENGHCTVPNKCECNEGYEKNDDGVCKPKCQTPCHMGFCTAPNVCTCFPNYRQSSDSKFDCVPICDPVCDDRIKGSHCITPNECRCREGYNPSANGEKCLPVCHNYCHNGDCIAPDTCNCWNGYEQSDNGSCSPVCDEECVDGDCVAPQTCKCHAGYTLDPSDKFYCRPVCESCENGQCVLPNTCLCWAGFSKNSSGICAPECSKPCSNGHCTQPETCTCAEGYVLDENDPFSCSPYCEKCEYGNCIAPNKCHCWEGYEKNSTDYFTCNPVCTGCNFGVCTGPEQCKCFESYEWNFSTQSCEIPKQGLKLFEELLNGSSVSFGEIGQIECEYPCLNNSCFGENCQCTFRSFLANEYFDSMYAFANHSCDIGKCFDNVCECSGGYVSTNEYTCRSLCARQCTNGVCTDLNSCECLDGYTLETEGSKGSRCSPLCNGTANGCIGGECISPDVCECFDGLHISPDNNFTCISLESPTKGFVFMAASNWFLYFTIAAISAAVLGFSYFLIKKSCKKNSFITSEGNHNEETIRYGDYRDDEKIYSEVRDANT